MKSSKILIFLFLIILINTGDIEIDFSKTLTTNSDYTVERNTVILSKEEDIVYKLTGTSNNYNIKVSASCSIILNSLKLSSPSFAPILIEENKVVNINLNGESNLSDTSSNQNEGVI